MNNALSLALVALALYLLTRGGPPAVPNSPLLSSVPNGGEPQPWAPTQPWVTVPGGTELVPAANWGHS